MRAFQELAVLAEAIPVLPLPMLAGRSYGEIWRSLEQRGEMIGGNDLWIAAHAMAAQLTLVTNNEGEFRRVSGLSVENWFN